MSGDVRTDPRGIKPSSTNGDVLSTTGGVAAWGSPPASGVQSVVQGANVTVDNADPAHPVVAATLLVPLTTETAGVPDLVWDDDNQLVLTEGT